MPITEKNNLSVIFSDIAPYYDFLNRVLSFNSDKIWRKKVIDAVQIKENARILDLCTGTADLAIECAKRKRTCWVYGVDFSWPMLKNARDKINKLQLGQQIHLIKADVFRLPFCDNLFDLVSISFGLRNLIDPAEGIKKMASMLKTGGMLAILEFSPPPKNIAGKLFNFYLQRIIPKVARAFGGSSGAYSYLASSISAFLSPEQILSSMKAAGLKNVRMHKMCFETANCYYADK